MKTILASLMYAAIVTQSEGCDIVKKMTGREWIELPDGTKGILLIAGIGLALMLFFIRQYLTSPSRPEQK